MARTRLVPPPNPTVVDSWRERIGVCNGKVVRELDMHVAKMTRPSGKQKREAGPVNKMKEKSSDFGDAEGIWLILFFSQGF